jgi:hypothetical protein
MNQFVEKVSRMKNFESLVGEIRKSGRIPNEAIQFMIDKNQLKTSSKLKTKWLT